VRPNIGRLAQRAARSTVKLCYQLIAITSVPHYSRTIYLPAM
jgi:hypothetical protein